MAEDKIKFVNELKLDFDQKYRSKRMDIKRVGWIARFCRLTVEDVKAWRTANGIHVRIQLKENLHPLIAVLIQSLMGDDYARCAYNACRVLNLTVNPDKYSDTAHETWNVLYYKKLVQGEVVSREKFDPKLTNKLRKELCTTSQE
jgi:hypothetical protein